MVVYAPVPFFTSNVNDCKVPVVLTDQLSRWVVAEREEPVSETETVGVAVWVDTVKVLLLAEALPAAS